MTNNGNSEKKVPVQKGRVSKRKRDPDATRPKPKLRTKEESDEPREVWSKSKKKRMRMLRSKHLGGEQGSTTKPTNEKNESRVKQKGSQPSAAGETSELGRHPASGSTLQQAFKARLSGSCFRMLNEELYTTTSSSAYNRFKSSPELYEQYHEGFRHQVENWPVNPISVIVASLKSLASAHMSKNGKELEKIIVADFGCGDAELAKQLLKFQFKKTCPFKVHSFDLVAACDLVTACDMAHVPLQKSSVDVAVFCLSLMGTNLADLVREGHRVLKESGKLKIAEVRSRFETRDGKDELKGFVDVLDQLGFDCVKTDRSNKMFVLLELVKNGKKPKKIDYTAKPCIYKRR